MTSDESNPYRFIDAREADGPEKTETDPLHEGWDLRDYVAPEDEPVFSPEEIARLGRRWSFTTVATILLQAIGFVLLGLALPAVSSGPPPPRRLPEPDGVWLLIAVPSALGIEALLGWTAFGLARSLRYRPPLAAALGAAHLVPIANVLVLIGLGYQTVTTLRRHGIPANFLDANADSLPRAGRKRRN